MPDVNDRKPWDQIEALIQEADAARLDSFLDTLSPAQVARAISRLDDDVQAALLSLLEPEDAADLIEELSDVQGADIIEELPATRAAAIVDEMDSDHRADVLGEMDKGDAEAILRAMDPEEAEDARNLLTFPDDTAGGIMATEFVAYPQDLRVADVLQDLRNNAEEYADYSVQHAYVLSENRTLVGVLPLHHLVLAPSDAPLSSLMIVNPICILADASLDEVEQLFDRFTFTGLPVTDTDGHLVGLIRRGDAEQAVGERAEKNFMQFSGIIGGDELRSMGLFRRSFSRLSWLTLNMLLNIVAAVVIVVYMPTIEAVVALAVVLPIICNMSGSSGNQAVAVSIREMALGVVDPRDLVRVVIQETQVGLINGAVLGVLLGLVTFLWDGNPVLGLVVGAALALNTLVAVALGGGIPLALSRIKVDPAVAAAPIMTTIVDMCGFFLVLSFAAYAHTHGSL